MKKLIIINGTMGVGKSTICSILNDSLMPSVYLDGDWCWKMNPFVVSDENKEMVIDNITYMLKSFLNNTGLEYIIFCWVIHQEAIFEQILERLDGKIFDLYKITLVCDEKALENLLQNDIKNGFRKGDIIGKSIERLPLYENMDTIKLDTTYITPYAAAEKIMSIVKYA